MGASRLELSAPDQTMIRDTDTIPYRKSAAYARAVVAAALQRAAVRHHVHELRDQGNKPATSAVLRRPWFVSAAR